MGSFVPPIMVEVVETPPSRVVETPSRRGRRDKAEGLGASLDETWAYLVREQPEAVEEGELRRAIELSLLDCAVTLRRTATTPHDAHEEALESSRRLLDVAVDASPAQLRAAWKAKARQHHPDKGGDAAVFRDAQKAFEVETSKPTNEFSKCPFFFSSSCAPA